MAIKDYLPLNTALMANPVNWFVVFGMVIIGGLAIAFILPGTVEKEEN